MEKQQLEYLTTGKKTCSNCNTEKTVNDFYKRKEGKILKLRSHCKECMHLKKTSNEVNLTEKRQVYRENKQKRAKDYRRRFNFDRKEKIRDSALKNKYNITIEEFNKMKETQKSKCYICQLETKKLCVDHCHETGKVRKLLCDNCNKTLGLMKENKESFKKMIEYIEEHKTCGFCETYCNNSWCVTNEKDKK